MTDKADKPYFAEWRNQRSSNDGEVTKSGKPLPPLGWWREQDLAVGRFFRQIAEFSVMVYEREELLLTHEVYDENGVLIGEVARLDPIIAHCDVGRACPKPVATLGLVSLQHEPAVYRMIPSTWKVREKVNS